LKHLLIIFDFAHMMGYFGETDM